MNTDETAMIVELMIDLQSYPGLWTRRSKGNAITQVQYYHVKERKVGRSSEFDYGFRYGIE